MSELLFSLFDVPSPFWSGSNRCWSNELLFVDGHLDSWAVLYNGKLFQCQAGPPCAYSQGTVASRRRGRYRKSLQQQKSGVQLHPGLLVHRLECRGIKELGRWACVGQLPPCESSWVSRPWGPSSLRPTPISPLSEDNFIWDGSGFGLVCNLWLLIQDFTVTIFVSTKAGKSHPIPQQCDEPFPSSKRQLFTATTGFTVTCLSDTDSCVSKIWNTNWSWMTLPKWQ